jgi:RNA methyltransferase, TrmH family
MPVRIVQSKQNSRLKELRRALAQPGREAGGIVGIEGPNLVEEALRANVTIKCVFAGERMQHWLQALPLPPQTEVLVMPSGVLTSVLTTETPQPVAALVEPRRWTWIDLLSPREKTAPLILILAELQDPGNLGTIIRSAEAFGATGIVALPGTVSAWNPKAVRASAGSVFRVPLLHIKATDALAELRKAGVTVLTTAVRAAKPASLLDLTRPLALIIGNEGNGVPEDVAALADAAITIPCPGPVESLNAAVAASVLLYEVSRQRALKTNRPLKPQDGLR